MELLDTFISSLPISSCPLPFSFPPFLLSSQVFKPLSYGTHRTRCFRGYQVSCIVLGGLFRRQEPLLACFLQPAWGTHLLKPHPGQGFHSGGVVVDKKDE